MNNLEKEQSVYLPKRFKILERFLAILPLLVLIQFRLGILPEINHYFPKSFLSKVNDYWQIAQVCSFVLVTILFLFKSKIDKFIFIYGMTLIALLSSTILNNNELSRFISLTISPITVVLAISIGKSNGNLNSIIKYTYLYHGLLIVINFILVILFPDSLFIDGRGMGVMYLFGNYQGNFNWFVVFVVLSQYTYQCIFNKSSNIRYFNNGIYILMFITSLIVWSVTTMIALGVCFLLVFLYDRYRSSFKVFNIFTSFFMGFSLTIFIGVFDGLKYFSFIIETIFHKSISMGSRTLFWENAMKYFFASPVLGMGFESSAESIENIGKSTAHNHYINILYNGGIIYFILTLALIYIVHQTLRDKIEVKFVRCLSAGLISYFVYFITEARLNNLVFMFILAFGYYVVSDRNLINKET